MNVSDMPVQRETIADAIRHRNARAAARYADNLRSMGASYSHILTRVQTKIDPTMTAAEWDALLYEAEDEE